jgi:hypothetical protein
LRSWIGQIRLTRGQIELKLNDKYDGRTSHLRAEAESASANPEGPGVLTNELPNLTKTDCTVSGDSSKCSMPTVFTQASYVNFFLGSTGCYPWLSSASDRPSSTYQFLSVGNLRTLEIHKYYMLSNNIA